MATTLAVLFALGVDLRRIVVLAWAVYLPVVAGCLVLLMIWRLRPDDTTRSAVFCEAVASELRAGSSVRSAVIAAADATGVRGLSPFEPMESIAARVAETFAEVGDELRLTISMSARSGADSASLFHEIGTLALAQAEIRREVRTATAPARATALVLVGAPVGYVAWQITGGGIGGIVGSSAQRIAAMAGLGVFLLGVGATAFLLWRSAR
ncbi:MAG TPA: hypothetical protein VFS66_10150 [Acidimicrobiia bacterium]|nr:hypothetical protein [Acidimicrobiia bacterium]